MAVTLDALMGTTPGLTPDGSEEQYITLLQDVQRDLSGYKQEFSTLVKALAEVRAGLDASAHSPTVPFSPRTAYATDPTDVLEAGNLLDAGAEAAGPVEQCYKEWKVLDKSRRASKEWTDKWNECQRAHVALLPELTRRGVNTRLSQVAGGGVGGLAGWGAATCMGTTVAGALAAAALPELVLIGGVAFVVGKIGEAGAYYFLDSCTAPAQQKSGGVLRSPAPAPG